MQVVVGFQPLATLCYSGSYRNPAPGALNSRPYVQNLTVIRKKLFSSAFAFCQSPRDHGHETVIEIAIGQSPHLDPVDPLAPGAPWKRRREKSHLVATPCQPSEDLENMNFRASGQRIGGIAFIDQEDFPRHSCQCILGRAKNRPLRRGKTATHPGIF